jgi:hypothetical protein
MKPLYLQDSYLHERPHKVSMPYVITLFNLALIGFEWSMTRLLLENIYKNDTSGSSLDMYICIHVRDKGIYSRGI